MAFVVADHGLQWHRAGDPVTGDAAELEVGVGEVGSMAMAFRSGDGFGVLVALLVDESELILGLAIVGIDGRGLEHAAEALAAAQSGAQPESSLPRYQAKNRKNGEASMPSRKRRGPQKNAAAARGSQESATTPAAIPFSTPKTVRTAKNMRRAK
jgi:hypothetical protein